MRYSSFTLAGALVILATSLFGAAPRHTDFIPYPEGFRTWTHVKSAINERTHPQFGKFSGIYNIYANKLAVKGYRTGNFRDGSVLVFDLKKSQTKDHVTQSIDRHFIDVMLKDAKRYKETGGWGYEEFRGNSRDIRTISTTNGEKGCHSCHETKAAQSFIFSLIAD